MASVTKRGSKWYAMWRGADGKLAQKATPARTKAEAMRFAADKERQAWRQREGLDPAPDDDYGHADAPTTFAGRHKDRRAIIFVGSNDGMIHAIDARTGFEVWAFIPYNLLPKLKTFRDGQAVDQYDYFVDSSPKIAEVKINSEWRSLLLIGEGPGGTFYQCFDVTEAGMGVDPSLDGLGAVNAMLALFDTERRDVIICRAGHTLPVIGGNGNIGYIDTPGIGLGLEQGEIFDARLEELRRLVRLELPDGALHLGQLHRQLRVHGVRLDVQALLFDAVPIRELRRGCH